MPTDEEQNTESDPAEDAGRTKAERKQAKAARRSAKGGGQAAVRKSGKTAGGGRAARKSGKTAGGGRAARKSGKTAAPAAHATSESASEGDILDRLDRIEVALETQSKRSKEVLRRVNELLGPAAGESASEKDG